MKYLETDPDITEGRMRLYSRGSRIEWMTVVVEVYCLGRIVTCKAMSAWRLSLPAVVGGVASTDQMGRTQAQYGNIFPLKACPACWWCLGRVIAIQLVGEMS